MFISEKDTMKTRSLWKLLYVCGVVVPFGIAAPADVSSLLASDTDTTTGESWVTGTFLTIAGLAVLIKLVAMCACGEKSTSDPTSDTNQPPPVQLLSQQSSDSQNEAQPSSPLPTTPNGASYQNMPENGEGQHSPKKDEGEVTNGASTSPQISRTATIDRQLPAIPPINKGRSSIDYDDDYDTIKDSRKEDDYDGTYARVKENKKVISTIDEAEGDYADVPDVRRRVMPDDFGEYAAVATDTVKRSNSESTREMSKTPAIAPERIAPRAESEDISDAEYAVVDLKQTKGAGPSSSRKDDVEPYESVKVGRDTGAVGGAKVPRKNHGYAKIDDIRGNTPGPSSNETRPEGQSMVEGVDLEAGPSPTGSPHHSSPQMSPTHSAGSPAHQQRSLPEIDATATGLPTPHILGASPPSVAASNDPGSPNLQFVEEQASVAQSTNKKEPRYSQVSARESLVRVRARQQQEQLSSGATAEGSLLHYQMVPEESQREDEDHNGYYESVDYQAVEENRSREPYSNTRATSRTLPPRGRGRVYEEISDTGDQPAGATADIEPYAVVEPLSRRKTAPSRYSAKSDSSESDHSGLYAKVDKHHKMTRGLSADNQVDEKDFDELYAKVNKKPKPPKIASFDETASDPENDVTSADGLYAEVKKPSSGQRSSASNGTRRNNGDFDDSYQSIDELSTEKSIAKAKEVGMVHIDDVQTAPVVWTRPEHTYASVDTDSERNNSERSSPNHCPPRGAHHNYEVVSREQLPKSNGQQDSKNKKKVKGKDKTSSSSAESPTHLDKRQLDLLADKNVKETDL